MLLCAVIAFLSGWAGHWLGSRKRSIVHVPETVVRHDTIRSAIPEPEVIVREVPTEVDTAAILADYFSEKHYLDTIIERPYLKVELTDAAMNAVIDQGFDPVYGARPLKRFIQSKIETLVAKHIIAADVKPGDTLTIDVNENGELYMRW